MRRRHWLRTIILSAAVAAVPSVCAVAQTPETSAEVSQAEFDQLTRALFAVDGLPSRERDEAAKRLLQRPSERATAALLEALRSGRAEPQTAVARAVAESRARPPGAFLEPLMLCLQPGIAPELAAAASRALANYRDEPAARARIRDFILSANVNEKARAEAVRGLDTFNDKDTVKFLVEQILKGDVSPRLSDAAADALVEITGKTELGHDVGQWDRWWQDEQNLTPQAFLERRRDERESAAQKNVERLRQIASAIRDSLVDSHHRITDPVERQAYIATNLDKPVPEFRAAAAGLVNIEQSSGTPIGAPLLEKLRGLIGDSSPEVRQAVAGALSAVNDALAARPLLAQLQRERIPSVKAAMIDALAPTKNVEAVPELIRQLDDPAFQVAEAAARALGLLGPEIIKNQALTRQVSNALTAAMDRTARLRGAGRLREYLAEAMVPLHDPALVPALFPLLEDRDANTPNVRRNAVKALASMNVPALSADIAGRVADLLRYDRDKGVRLDAANALGIVGSPAQRAALLQAMDPAREADEAVRDAAWKSLSSLLPQFSAVDQSNLAEDEKIRNVPDRQLTVYLVLNKKLVEEGPPQAGSLADVQQRIGALYLDKLDKPEEAIPYLMAALNYWDALAAQAPGVGVNVEILQGLAMKSYLRAKKYKVAMAFGADRIVRKPENVEPIAQKILEEVDRLEKANQVRQAIDLLAEAKTLRIEKQYGDRLLRKDEELRSRNPGWLGPGGAFWRVTLA